MTLMLTAGSRVKTRRAAIAVCLLAVAGCASDEPDALPPVNDISETVALGEYPEPLSEVSTVPTLPTTVPVETSPTTEPPREPITGPIGDEVFGNRILMIGDTVIASTAPRFDGVMCDALEAFGWQAEIAAEVGRFVEFGRTVVDARIVPAEPEWDAAGVMLGNHFDGDLEAYRAELDALLTELSPRPVLLYTIVEDDTFHVDVNAVIRDMPRFHAHVVLLDWAEITAADDTGVILADTPSGLSDEGRRRLALFTAAALGEPPVTAAPGCVPPVFVDDSAIVV